MYRETVVPTRAGTPFAPITFTAYPGETPVISGAEQLTGWRVSSGAVYERPNVTVPPSVVAQDGEVLARAQSKDGLVPGGFYYDNTTQTLYVRLYNDGDPNASLVEAAVRSHAIGYLYTDYLVFDGFEIRHTNSVGVGLWGASNVTLQNLVVHDTTDGGIQIHNGSNDVVVRDSTIYDYGRNESYAYGIQVIGGSVEAKIRGNSVYMTYPGLGQDQTGIMIDQKGHASEIVGNTVRDNRNEGIVIFQQPDGVGATSVFANHVSGNGDTGIAVIQADSEGPVTIDIRGNVVLDNARRDTSDTHGIKVGDLARGDSVVRVAENQVSGTPSSQNGFEHNGIQIYESKGVDVSENEVSYVDIGVKLQSNATAWLTANHIELTRETSILVDDTSAVLP